MSALETVPNAHTASAAAGGDTRESGEVIRVPLSLAYRYVSALRRQHPGATPRQLQHVLEKRYLLAMSLGGTGTGLLALGRSRTASLLGVSATHLGVSATISAFHLLTLAAVYGLSPAHAQDLLQRCSFGEISGDIVEQQLGVGDSWWSTALAYLPASQVRFVDRLAETALPAGIATTLGFSGGRILGHRVIRAAVSFLGAPPNHFTGTDRAPRRVR